jgi:signal transduction histidine kinase
MTHLQATGAVMGADVDNEIRTWPALHGRLHTAVRILWVIWALGALGIFIASLPAYFGGVVPHSSNLVAAEEISLAAEIFDVAGAIASISAALVSMGLATLLFLRKSDDGMAMFVSFLLLTYGIVMAGPLERLALLLDSVGDSVTPAQTILLATPILLLALMFPSGRFVPRWTRWLVPASLIWIISVFALPPMEEFSTVPPIGIMGVVILALSLPLFGLYAQIYRYRNVSTLEERQQTKWVVYGLGLWFLSIIIASIPYMIFINQPEGTPVTLTFRIMALMWWVSMLIIPVSLTLSVLRYRLWEIDFVVNRTLVYGSLTAIVVVIYVLIVGGLGMIFQSQGSLLVALVATGLIAVLFQPLRAMVQKGVNRLVYGDRDDPVTALTRLGKQLEGTMAAEDVLPTLVESVAESLKLPYSAIGLEGNAGYHIAAEYGIPAAGVIDFPLVYQSEPVGRLSVAPRSPTESFNPADMRLLRDIARQAGAAVHSVQLTQDLQRSRQQLVTAREEERRRLRRDIHDGLGPSLAAHMLAIGSARAALTTDPDDADQLLAQLERDLDSTLNEVRRLVYNLRPPELDQLGLVGALTRYASQYSNGAASDDHRLKNDFSVQVQASDNIPPLPAAVEVAAYRITLEAINNVVRHAQARTCVVNLDFSDALLLLIRDDGKGIAETVEAGVGLASMRERALELGGTCEVKTGPDFGTRIEAVLPLPDTSSQSTKLNTKNI